jgi:hypothetical protein
VDVSKQQRHNYKGHQKEQNGSCRKGSKGNQQEERQQQTTATSEDYQQQRKWLQQQKNGSI